MTKRVFIADKLSEEALACLGEYPEIEVDFRPGLPLEEKLKAAACAHVLVVRSATKVDAQFLDVARSLELVVRAGVGVDNVDIDRATRKGVVVENVPDGNVRSAAEHTIALILAVSRHIPQAHGSLRDGKWEREQFLGIEVQGKTLGVVGLGKIGRHVIHMAAGLGFRVLVFDPFVGAGAAEALGVELVKDLGELASQSDYLTVHVPKNDRTSGLINREVLSRARAGIRIINCARGGIVDEAALLESLNSGEVAGAALDVFEDEPPSNVDLVRHPKVVVTPHLGASTREAQEHVALSAARQVVDYCVHGKLSNPVNTVILDPDLRERVEPYVKLAQRLGQLQSQLLQGNPERVVVKYYGEFFDHDVQSYLSAAVLEGFLRGHTDQPITRVNAWIIAREEGLAVEERNEGSSKYFVNMVRVEVTDSCGSREAGGTIRGRRGVRLVSFEGYQFDAIFEGNLIITSNEDRPGMIAVIGQALSSDAINISNMSLGRDETGGTAIALINVDNDVAPSVIDDLKSRDGILWATAVTLE